MCQLPFLKNEHEDFKIQVLSQYEPITTQFLGPIPDLRIYIPVVIFEVFNVKRTMVVASMFVLVFLPLLQELVVGVEYPPVE